VIQTVSFLLWAHFRREAPETGLSACIFFACGKKGYRFYPSRENARTSIPYTVSRSGQPFWKKSHIYKIDGITGSRAAFFSAGGTKISPLPCRPPHEF
jgi:hypothetical protein